jgi:hypothetical protein
MEFMPEGCTPVEYNESPELITSWANKLAQVNVRKAAQLMQNLTYECSSYTRYLQEFNRDLKRYKNALFEEINLKK